MTEKITAEYIATKTTEIENRINAAKKQINQLEESIVDLECWKRDLNKIKITPQTNPDQVFSEETSIDDGDYYGTTKVAYETLKEFGYGTTRQLAERREKHGLDKIDTKLLDGGLRRLEKRNVVIRTKSNSGRNVWSIVN